MESDNRLNNTKTFNLNPFNINSQQNDNNNAQFTNAITNALNNPIVIQNLTDSILLNINKRGINLKNNNNTSTTDNNITKNINKKRFSLGDSDDEILKSDLEYTKVNINGEEKTIKKNLNAIEDKKKKKLNQKLKKYLMMKKKIYMYF